MSIADISIEKPYQDCIMIYGFRGSGKTELLKVLVVNLDRKGIRVIVFDTMHNHNYRLEHGQIVKPPFKRKQKVFEKVAEQVWNKGNMVFVIEEIDQYCTPHYNPPCLDSLINVGRNRKISLLMTTRRIAGVHKDLVANCQHHFIFQSFLPQDLEYYDDYIGKIVWKAKDLPPYHFIHYRVGSQPQFCRPIKRVKALQ